MVTFVPRLRNTVDAISYDTLEFRDQKGPFSRAVRTQLGRRNLAWQILKTSCRGAVLRRSFMCGRRSG